MLLIAAAAIVATAQPAAHEPPPRASAQARATVRILFGVRLRLGEERNSGAPPARDTQVRSEGVSRPAKLIEFE